MVDPNGITIALAIMRARLIGIRWDATGIKPVSLRRRVLKLRKSGALRSVASEVWES